MEYYTIENLKSFNRLANYSDFDKKLSEPLFSKSDTELSFRQINTLAKDIIIDDKRDNKQAWRKFNYFELVFLDIVKDLKNFGFTNKQLLEIKNKCINSQEFSKAVKIALLNAEVILAIEGDMNITFYNREYFELLTRFKTPYAVFNLTEITNKLRKKISDGIKIPFEDFSKTKSSINSLSAEEREVINSIRNPENSKIKIVTPDNKMVKYYAEQKYGERVCNMKKLIEIIESKSWGDFIIQKRSGKIVSIKAIDVFKFT